MPTEKTAEKVYLRRQAARRMLGDIGDSTFYHWISQGLLPKPIHIGRTSFWDRDEIIASMERLRAQRKQDAAA